MINFVSPYVLRRGVAALFAFLFCWLVLSHSSQLTWPQYVRLFFYLLLGTIGPLRLVSTLAAPLSAAVMVAVLAEFGNPMEDASRGAIWLGLLFASCVGVLFRREIRPLCLSTLEWTVVGMAAATTVLSILATELYDLSELWPSTFQWGLYAALWLSLSRWLSGYVSGKCYWLFAPVAIGLGSVCLAGGVLLAATIQVYRSARAFEATGDYASAAIEFSNVQTLAQRLDWSTLESRSRQGSARALLEQGESDQARALFGIPESQTIVVQTDQWEGSTGALLFKSVGCWVDLWLLDGTVDVKIEVHGQPARGEWPRLDVELAGTTLGQIDLADGTYSTFSTRVTTGRRRLKVRLRNGFWTSEGEQRLARIERVELRYREQDE